MSGEEARELFAELMAQPDHVLRLDRAALAVARGEYPALDAERYLAHLDQMAAQLRPRLSPEEPAARLVAEVNSFLFGEEAFHGNAHDYYDPRNSYLNDVLDRRTGIPITLSLLYIELGRRVGLPIEGIGLPGHFLARCPDGADGILIDPFNGGAILSVADCAERVRQMYGNSLRFSATMLQAAAPREIIARTLGNLKGAYLRRGDLQRALRAVDWGLLAAPGQPNDLRERGLIRYRLGDVRGAIADLEQFLGLAPSGALAERTRAQLQRMEALWQRRN